MVRLALVCGLVVLCLSCAVGTPNHNFVIHPASQSKPAKRCNRCPNGWTTYEKSCYIVEQAVSRDFCFAQLECNRMGGNLVRIDSRGENDFVEWLIDALNVDAGIWIGLTDFKDDSSFFWVGSFDLPVNFTNWQNGEPSVTGPGCAELLFPNSDGEWVEATCSSRKPYVCERSFQNETDQCNNPH